jgi:SAM-dependent methyltransferase
MDENWKHFGVKITVAMALETERDDWDKHWDDFSEASEMGPATLYRHRAMIRLLGIKGSTGRGVRLLDIGSGTGGFAALFCELFPEVEFLGLELSASGVRKARARVPNATFLQRDLLADDESDRLFGATHAVCSEVLEHLDDPGKLLRRVQRYMAHDCKLIVTVPGGTRNKFDIQIGHRRHFTGDSVRNVLEDAGYHVERSNGIGFPFFNLYRMLTAMRGDKLAQDVSGPPSLVVRLGTAVFNPLFRLNLDSFGWQTIAVARLSAT